MKTLFAILLLLCCLIAAPLVLGQETDDPILVIDPQGHSDMIREVIFTPDGKALISVADDKTIRLWDTGTGELLNTLRGQIGNGPEGKLYAAALSPDGTTLAVGGYMKDDEIRLIDIQSGEQIGLLKEHCGRIAALAFSKDGRLASGSFDHTVRIWDVAARKKLAELTGHTDDVYGVAFSPDGDRLVSASHDRKLRLWDLRNVNSNSDKVTSTVMQQHSDKVYCVAFAPNGQYIVSGGKDDKILLWDGQGNFMKEVGELNDNVLTISFSEDSTKIVAMSVEGAVYAIPSGEKLTSFTRHDNTVVASAFFGTDRIATAGGDDNDIYLWDAGSETVQQRIVGQGRRVWVAAFGKGLELAFGNSSPTGYLKDCPLEQSFDFSTMSLHPQTPTKGKFRRTRTEHRGMSLETKGDFELKIIGGGTIENDRGTDQKIRSYTFTPKGNIVVGSSYSLKLYRPNSSFLRKFIGHTGEVWAVSVDQSGRILASASNDQTIKLWNLQTGELLASLFVARDKEWICWTPQGYYAASSGGEKYMGWQINQGMDKAAEYYPAYVFRKRFHNPELVSRTIEWASFDKALAEQNRQPGKGIIPEKITEILPPQVRWLAPERSPSSTEDNTILIRAEVSSAVKIIGLKIQVNGATAATFSEIRQQPGKGKFDRIIEYTVSLVPQENKIQVYAENSHASITSKARTVRYDSLDWQKPRLYMVSIGIKDYKKDKPLDYAVIDAQAMARLFRTQKGRLFKEVHLKTLYNSEATEGRIIEALQWLKDSVTQNDIAVVFIAAHGYKHRENYYILPVEGDPKNLRQTAVDWRDYKDILGNLSTSKVLLYLDTCYSGQLAKNLLAYRGADNRIDNTEAIRELTSGGYGVVIMAASTGNELSQEHPDWGHGAFTKALIEGFEQEKAERNGDSIINLQELDIYVTERVKELTDGKQHAKTNYSPGISISRFPIFQVR